MSLGWCGEGGGQTFLQGFFSWHVKETCLINAFLKCSAAALKKNPTFYSTHSCLQRKMVCGKRKWLFLGSPTQLENTGEVLGTEPFLWLLSAVIALGCVTDVQHTYSQKKEIPFENISVAGSFSAGPPFAFLCQSPAEIRSCLITACWDGAGQLSCAREHGHCPSLAYKAKK